MKVGNPCVTVRGVGRVSELAPGDFFGELAMLGGAVFRTATVLTTDMLTSVYALHRDDLFRLTKTEQRQRMLEKQAVVYDEQVSSL